MKEIIQQKFEGIKHKWIFFDIDSNIFRDIIAQLTLSIKSNKISNKDAMSLIKTYKFHEKVFVKYIKNVGRKNFNCVCNIIDKNNNKIEIVLKPADVISSQLLNGTPKSLKLYIHEEKAKGYWKKPNDNFIDPVSYPPVEEELTELGYKLYKSWQEEVAASGLNHRQYFLKMRGLEKYYNFEEVK